MQLWASLFLSGLRRCQQAPAEGGGKRAAMVQLEVVLSPRGLWETVGKSFLLSEPTWPSRITDSHGLHGPESMSFQIFSGPLCWSPTYPPQWKGLHPSTCNHSPLCRLAFMEHPLSARHLPGPLHASWLHSVLTAALKHKGG